MNKGKEVKKRKRATQESDSVTKSLLSDGKRERMSARILFIPLLLPGFSPFGGLQQIYGRDGNDDGP